LFANIIIAGIIRYVSNRRRSRK